LGTALYWITARRVGVNSRRSFGTTCRGRNR